MLRRLFPPIRSAARVFGLIAGLAPAMVAVGAFELPAGSADAALVWVADRNLASVEVEGAGKASGVALAEVYDLDPPGPTRRLNLSGRAVANRTDALIAGFVITGSAPKRVLVRAVGPGLATFGVAPLLANPRLILRDAARAAVESNDDRGGDPAVADAATAVNAFPLNPAGSDAAMVMLLQPGNYTLECKGAAGDAGVVLLEVYDLD